MTDKKRLIKKQGIEIEEFINLHPKLDSFTKTLIGKVLQFGYNVGNTETVYDFQNNPWDAAKVIERYNRIKLLLGFEEDKYTNGELKHPIHIPGYSSAEELAEDIANLNYFSNQIVYNRLIQHYKNQAKHNQDLGKNTLAANLEELAKAFSLVDRAMKKVCNNSEKHTVNPFDITEENSKE